MDKILELQNINKEAVTLEDCITLHEMHGIATVINDGHVVGFEEE